MAACSDARAARDAELEERGRQEARREGRQERVATIDKRGARIVGMTDKRRAAIGETTTSCYALRFLRRFATGILEIGSRSERNAARVARNVAAIDKRARDRRDDRQEAHGDRGGDHELLRLAVLAALRNGDFGDRQSVREERREGRQERRDDRQEGREDRRDDRQEARGDRGGDHELLRLALLAALRNGDFGDRQSVREERREGRQDRRDDRQEGREDRRDDRQEARGDRGGDHELLRLAVLAALRDGDFGDRQSVREERREGRQDRRDDRQEGREDRRDDRRDRSARRNPDGDRE